jgi:hypothetical protein
MKQTKPTKSVNMKRKKIYRFQNGQMSSLYGSRRNNRSIEEEKTEIEDAVEVIMKKFYSSNILFDRIKNKSTSEIFLIKLKKE